MVDSLGLDDDDSGPVANPSDLGALAPLSEHQLDVNRFRRIQKLGEGTFSAVYLAHDPMTDWRVVVKELQHGAMTERQYELFTREVRILFNSHNPFVLPCVGFSARPPYSIVTRYVEGGSLYDALHKRRKTPLNPIQRTCIALGVAHGMRYLHRCNVIHRDLKSPNILLDSLLVPQISDFGLSRFTRTATGEGPFTERIGTPQWMAPEQLKGTYDRSVDVFAFGMILYELITDTVPYSEQSETGSALCLAITDGYRPPLSGSSDIEKLILRCWSIDPADRPTFEDIYIWLATSVIQFPGTVSQSVRTFIRLKIENDIEPMNPVAAMTSALNEAQSAQRRLRGKARNIPEAFCHYAENGSIKNMAKYIRTVPALDINACNKEGRTPLFCAAYFGHHLAVLFLVSLRGIDVNKGDHDGITPLMAAAFGGHIETVRMLLAANGIDVNIQDSRGLTALHFAVAKSPPSNALAAELLANPVVKRDLKDGLGRTPLEFVRDNGTSEAFPSLCQ